MIRIRVEDTPQQNRVVRMYVNFTLQRTKDLDLEHSHLC